MPDKDTYAYFKSEPTHPAPRNWRNAALIGGGVLLLVLGIAAGMMMGRDEVTPLDYAPPGAGTPMLSESGTTPRQGLDPVDEALNQAARVAEPTGAQTGSAGRTSATAGPDAYESRTLARAVCEHCGVVESVTPVTVEGKGTGVGAVAGGVLGGVVGNQVGKGSGNTAATVLGAIGGGVAGNEIEKSRRSSKVYRITVRMDDGSVQHFTRSTELPAGTKVEVRGGELEVAGSKG